MINSNPETVSTDYDVSDLLFFEPLTHEDVLNICERLNGRPFERGRTQPDGHVRGVIVQYGGQTPLNLAAGADRAGVPILGTSPASIHLAEDRERFSRCCTSWACASRRTASPSRGGGGRRSPSELGYPVLVRPSYVLGGRGMQVCNNAPTSPLHRRRAHATDREVDIAASTRS
jgi:carbamoyl-phosphate synthase large subunit